jgi:hypothetical protein
MECEPFFQPNGSDMVKQDYNYKSELLDWLTAE